MYMYLYTACNDIERSYVAAGIDSNLTSKQIWDMFIGYFKILQYKYLHYITHTQIMVL